MAKFWIAFSCLVFLTLGTPPALANGSPFSYYPPGPTGTVGVSEPVLYDQVFIAPGVVPGGLSFTLTLDGRTVPAVLDAYGDIVYRPPAPLAPGVHTATLDLNYGRWQANPASDSTLGWSFTVAPGAPATLPPPDPAQEAALAAVNAYRAGLNLPPVILNNALDRATQQQADFYQANASRYAATGLSVHEQNPAWPGFVGRAPWGRDGYYGYPGGESAEDQADTANPARALRWWMDSVYHRFPVIDPGVAAVGFGAAPGNSGSPNTSYMDFGYFGSAPVAASTAVVYPADGQMGVPAAFQAGENPNPLAAFPGASYPVGYPITVSFPSPDVTGVAVTSATLSGAGGGPVPFYLLTPQNDPNQGELGAAFALIPQRPLDQNSFYRVTVQGTCTQNDASTFTFSRSWSFATAAPPSPAPAPTIRVVLNGTPLATSVPPAVAAGRVLLPFREVFRALGSGVSWNAAYPDRATATLNGQQVEINFGNFVAKVNGQPVTLDSPPQVVNGRSLVPLRFVAQALDLTVYWDASTHTVDLTGP